ncbi:SMC-Scp complex subunit ScpB [Spiroplasma endosymbiont of Anurida maritima]|uniref:SMC-Scp complex subunit ScpB n=1 Tax=Spiroplasma endosymbiont of Anurida maritima TaxID=2967972 RepID=UPI0036D406D4
MDSLLFIKGDEGITVEKIMTVTNLERDKIELVLNEIKSDLDKNEAKGITIQKFLNKYRYVTKKQNYDFIIKEESVVEKVKLSYSALEVLAIIAYNEPITKPEINDLRGVASDHLLNKLRSYDLIKTAGKSDLPGKPFFYKITENFYKHFDLKSKEDLPKISDLKQKEIKGLFNNG